MQFSVYLKDSCLTAVAPHRASRTIVKLLAEAYPIRYIGQNAVQVMCAGAWREIKAHLRTKQSFARPQFLYIPEKMPPREVPNCYFQPPQSDQWRIDHRTVSFFQ